MSLPSTVAATVEVLLFFWIEDWGIEVRLFQLVVKLCPCGFVVFWQWGHANYCDHAFLEWLSSIFVDIGMCCQLTELLMGSRNVCFHSRILIGSVPSRNAHLCVHHLPWQSCCYSFESKGRGIGGGLLQLVMNLWPCRFCCLVAVGSYILLQSCIFRSLQWVPLYV